MSAEKLQRVVDIEEIRQLRARYVRLVDEKDWLAWRDLFTEDLHFEEPPHVSIVGRDAVVEFVSSCVADAVTVHRCYTAEITVTGTDTAEGIWGMSDHCEWPGNKGAAGSGHYRERYRRTADGWRIAHVIVTRLQWGPLPGGFPDVVNAAINL
jgi:ketosteroid isomerase-like protein